MPTERLAGALRRYLESTGTTAVSIERSAGFPNGTVAGFCAGRIPRGENASKLLASLPDAVAREMLVAHMLDTCPEGWQHRVQILVSAADESTIQEEADGSSTPYSTRLQRALDALTKAAESDTQLGAWLIESAELMRLI